MCVDVVRRSVHVCACGAQIRSREGLAYSVYGAWDLPPDRPGLFVGGGETSSPGVQQQARAC